MSINVIGYGCGQEGEGKQESSSAWDEGLPSSQCENERIKVGVREDDAQADRCAGQVSELGQALPGRCPVESVAEQLVAVEADLAPGDEGVVDKERATAA